MKKLLLIPMFGLSLAVHGQNLIDENFNSLNIGNVGTDYTGATPTNNIFTQASNGTAPTTATNAGNDNFQIVLNDATQLNVLQITGTNGDKGSRQLWMDGFADQWTFRDAGNEILEVEYDLYTGTTGTSRNLMGLYVMDATKTKYLCGFVFNTNTLVLSGLAYYTATSAPIGNYTFYLNTGGTNLVLTPNTWVRIGVSYNKTTGQVKWKGPGFNGQVTGAAPATDPDRVSLVSTSGSVTTPTVISNTAAASTLFDNLIVRASATDTLLSNNQLNAPSVDFNVYPNPASNFVTVNNAAQVNISQILVSDVNGRIIKDLKTQNISEVSVDVTDLKTGVYLMKIISEQGTLIRKIIKN